jgi:hypothetical protein
MGGDRRSERIEAYRAHAAEQDRPDVAARREAWLQAWPELDPERA